MNIGVINFAFINKNNRDRIYKKINKKKIKPVNVITQAFKGQINKERNDYESTKKSGDEKPNDGRNT